MNLNDFFKDKKIIIIIVLSVIVASLVVFLILSPNSNSKPKMSAENNQDQNEMFDPDNPETTSDSMKNLYKQNISLKKEQKILVIESNNVSSEILIIDNQNYQNQTLVERGVLNDLGRKLLDQFSIQSLFNYYYGSSFDNKPETEQIYTASIATYSNIYANAMTLAHLNNPNSGKVALDANGNPYYSPLSLTSKPLPIDPSYLIKLPIIAKDIFNKLQSSLKARSTEIFNDINENTREFNSLRSRYLKTRFDIRGQAITWGITTFAATAFILYLLGLSFRPKLKTTHGQVADINVLQAIKDSTWLSVYMITVLLLIITIFILGLAGLLQENTLAALLGGIAGYVLNSRMDSKTQQSPVQVPTNGKVGE